MPNSIIKNSLIIGGLTFLGYMIGGKLGSAFGNFLFLPNSLKMFKNKWYKRNIEGI